jgi:HK97 family phage major capsid protein
MKHDLAALKREYDQAYDDLAALTETMNAPGYVENEHSDVRFARLREKVATLKAKMDRIRRAEETAKVKAVPVPDFALTPRVYAQPRPDYKFKAFKDTIGEYGQQERAEDKAYDAGMFLKAVVKDDAKAKEICASRGIVTKAQAESTTTAGGALVPDSWLDTIINLKEQFGVFRANAQLVQMTRDHINLPRRTGPLTAYFVGEGTTPTESTATWDNVALDARKLSILTKISRELLEDSPINVADWITAEAAYALAGKEDDIGFNGDGSVTYMYRNGLFDLTTGSTFGFNAAANANSVYTASGHTDLSQITATDMMLFMGLLPAYAVDGAKLYCTAQFATATLTRLAVAAGGNTLTTLGAGGVRQLASWLGVPIVISQKMPSLSSPSGKYACVYGRLDKAVAFGETRGMTIRSSADRYFDQDLIGVLATERVDINCHSISSPIATVSLKTTSAAGSGATLTFATGVPTSVVAGMSVSDLTTGSVIPANTIVLSTTGTTVIISNAVTGAGVGSGDTIVFAPSTYGTGIGPIVALKVG